MYTNNRQYQPIYKQAQQMQYHLHDFVGENMSSNPQARVLSRQMNNLMTDMRTGKNPRDLENRIKTIQHQMTTVEHMGQPLMSYDHANVMHHNFENMRRTVRRFNNYN